MASELGRGAQVRLDGDGRKYARGGTALRLIDNIRQKLEEEAAGSIADGSTADGSTRTGIAAEDEILGPGGDLGTMPGPLSFADAGTSGDYDAQLSVTGGGSQAAHGELGYTAALHHFNTYDGSEQFRVGYAPGATEFWQALGGATKLGPTLYATNGTLTGDVDGAFTAQGLGSLYLGSGGGAALKIAPPATPGTAYLTVTPGTATTNPTLGSSGTTTEIGATTAINFTIGGVVMGQALNRSALGATANFPIFTGSSGGVGIRAGNAAGSGVVNAYVQAQSTGQVSLLNDGGVFANFVNSAANTTVHAINFRAGSTTVPPTITTSNSGGLRIGEPLDLGGGVRKSGYATNTPTTGFSYAIPAGKAFILFTPAGTLAAGTVTLPASPVDGDTVTLTTTQTITALTMAVNATPASQGLSGNPTTLTPTTPVTMTYLGGAFNFWVRTV